MSQPRFNHVAMSVPSTMLDDDGRAELVDFYGQVFGWTEMPTMTKPGQQLVLQAYSYDQFVFVVSEDEPMRAPRMDHFGMATDTLEELQAFHERALERQKTDDRVDIIAPMVEDFEVLELHNFYVRFLLPMSVEVQHWNWAGDFDPRAET